MDSNKSEEQYLRVLPYLRRLAEWKIDYRLSCIFHTGQPGSWTSLWSDDNPVSHDSTISNSIATDGTYIYMHGSNGLLKIGTGHHATFRGRVYQQNNDWFPGIESSLVCIDTCLYFRSYSIAPASLVVLSCSNLQVRILAG